jgi:hypothetical protein
MEEIELELVHPGDGRHARGLLRLAAPDPRTQACALELIFAERRWARTSSDYFDALCLIRRDLEEDGWLLSCYGASREVYPSAMARDMGLGRKAYKTQLGRHARSSDLVDILATGPDVQPATVDEQAEFHRRWIAGPRR